MRLNPHEIKSIEQLATDLKKWADKLQYSHSPTVVRLRPKFGQKQVIMLLLTKMPAVGQKVEKEFNELYDMIGELNSWCTKSTATDDKFSEFQITVDQLKGAAYELVETLQQIPQQARQDLTPESPAETEQISTPPKRGRIWNGFKAFIQVAYRITIKSFWDSVMNK